MTKHTDSVESPDGTRIVFHTQGQGPPLVIVHGALVTTAMYQDLADLLSPHYRVLIIERRDYNGPSQNGPRPASFTTQATDLTAVLTTLDEPAHIFGHSAGGLVTLHAMSQTPSMIRRVALYEPPVVLAGPALSPTLDTIRHLITANRPVDAILEFFTAIIDSGVPIEALRPLSTTLASRAPGLVADLECLTAMSPDLTPWSTTNIPTLLLHGELTDSYGKKSIDLLESTLPQTHSIVLSGQHHHPDDPTPVAAALQTFFT